MSKSWIIVGLVLLAAVVVLGSRKGPAPTPEATSETTSPASVGSTSAPASSTPDSVVVYYFHGNRRCRTCVGIQRVVQRTVAERFESELGSAALAFREINIDEPSNANFVKEFNLSFSSMVVASKSGQATLQWKNCERVWPLAHDESALAEYVEEQIRSYLDLVERT